MTPEAINVALAEWMGWKFVKGDKSDPWVMKHDDHWKSPVSLIRNGRPPADMWFGGVSDLPNYYGSLDAVAEAEGALGPDRDYDEYRRLLSWVCERDYRKGNAPHPHSEFATAPQRCEALCRTLRLGDYRNK